MFKNITILFAALFLLGSSVQAADATKYDLKWNFAEGQKFNLQGSVALDGTADIPSQMLLPPGVVDPNLATGTEKASGEVLFTFHWGVTVQSVDPQGNADLTMELKSADIKANGKIGEQQIQYAVDLMEPALTGEGLQALVNPQDAINTWKVAPNGKVLAINGQDIDQSLAKMQQELANSGLVVDAKELRQFTDMFLYFMTVYPTTPVAVGEKWSRQADLSKLLVNGSDHDGVKVNNFNLMLRQDWNVKNESGSNLTLEESSGAMPQFSISLDGPEATINFDATGTGKSQVTVDHTNGRVSASDQQLNITGNLNALEKKGTNQQFKIPFKVNMQSKFSLTE